MKRNLLFAATLATSMLQGVSVYADDAPVSGTYYIENVGASRFIEGGNSWGTQASVSKRGIEFTLVANEDATYSIASGLGKGYLGTNGFIDSDSASWTLTPTEEGAFILSTAITTGTEEEPVTETKYLTWTGEGTALAIADEAPTTANGYFKFITKDDRIAALANATADVPVSATFLIGAPNFNRVESIAPWTMVASNKNLAGGANDNFCAESYHSVFSLTQTITIPAGVYSLTAQGFYRQDGSDNENLPYFFIGEEKGTFPLKTGTENSMTDASNSFTKGLYTIDPIYFEMTEDGEIELGAKNDVNTSLWCIWDNFQLNYYGTEANLAELKLGAYVAQLENARATAIQYQSADLNEATKAIVDAAVAETETVETTEEAYKAAIATLTAANDAAKACAENKAAIDARFALLESTNVYAQEAYDTFKAAAEDYLAKWTANELTEKVVNPNSLQAWHAANDYDDFLLSAWGTKDFDTNLYINTWSVEGETDGSEFKVPFFEYWTGDGNSLGATTKTATVTGLEADKLYAVSAWVRVRIKDGATGPTGITLSVGADGTPVDVTKGEQVGESQMYLAKFATSGKTDAEGNLTINFNVEEGNNISWLSFKNVNYDEFYTTSNLDFSEGTPVDNGICTYEKDMAANNTTYSQMQEVQGWSLGNENGDARAGGIFTYGSNHWLGGTGYNVPATNPEGAAEGNALGVVSVWGATTSYTQKVTLPAGNYVINIPVYNAVGGTSVPVKSLIGFIAEDGTEYLADAKAYPVDTWTTETITFTLKQQATGVLSLGYAAQGSGSGANPHLFFDKVEITTVTDAEMNLAKLQAAIAAASATVEARANVGDGLFQIPTEALETYTTAVVNAQTVADNTEATAEELATAIETLNAATEAYAATPVTAPKADAEYTIKQNISGNYLTLEADNVSVEAEAAPLKFETAGNNTYYIVDADGEYVGYEGSNKWTMSTNADKKAAWTITCVGDGLYTIKGLNGCIATDNTEAGSTCYGDKAADNEKGLWIIEEIAKDVHKYVIDINVERTTGLGYTNQSATVDMADVCAKLGVESVTNDNVRGVNPDGTYIEDAMTVYDGWHNAEGAFEKWGENTTVCVKFDATVSEDNINICTMNTEPAVGETYTAVWAVVTESDTVLINTNITFVAPETPEEVEIVKTITVNHEEDANTAYSAKTATFDVAAVTEALGIENITDAKQYIVNVTTGEFVMNTTDGWRDANGDAAMWADATNGVCVKIQDPASGSIDYIGCHDENFNVGDTYTAKWGFVYDNKAVVIDVVITFVTPVGIDGISADNIVKTQYFSANGAAINAPQKGINIVKMTLTDGKVVTKKVLVK